MQEYLIKIEGCVQGVGYRAFSQQEAARLGLNGRADNLADGRVEIVVQGNQVELDRFVERLREGPRLAIVDDITVIERSPTSTHDSFEVG